MQEATTGQASVIDRYRADAGARRKQAAEHLRDILLRNDSPKKGDEAALGEAVRELGIEPGRLPALVETLERLTRFEKLVPQLEERRSAVAKARGELAEVDTWAKAQHEQIDKEADAKRAPLATEVNAAAARLRQAEEARRYLIVVRSEWESAVQGITQEEALEQLRPKPGVS